MSGCYEVDHEVISASDAVFIPHLAGRYTYTDNPAHYCDVTKLIQGNDYVYSETDKGKVLRACLFRAVPLRDNIYIVQIKETDAKYYYLSFYQFPNDKNSFETLDPSGVDDVALAKRYNVSFTSTAADDPGDGPMLSGSDTDIMSFLYAFKNAKFESGMDDF